MPSVFSYFHLFSSLSESIVSGWVKMGSREEGRGGREDEDASEGGWRDKERKF